MCDESQIASNVFNSLSEMDKKYLAKYERKNLITLHHSFGQSIRNQFKLWENAWTPELVDGVDYSPNHPDSISQRIIEHVWEKCKVWKQLEGNEH